jgi:hypothetical protein
VFSIFSDRRFLATESTPHAVILAPFWGTNPESAGEPETGRFARYAAVGASFLRLTELEDSEVAVFPQNWESAGDEAGGLAEQFTAVCVDAGKPAVFFSGSDSTEPLPVDAVTFRTSILRSERRANEFALPAWSEDFLERYLGGELQPRRRNVRPVVGFCGNTLGGLPAATRVERLLRRTPEPQASHLTGERPRTRALRALGSERRIETNFVLRGDFLAGAHGDPAALVETRSEYVQNMQQSDYILCVRGIGNFSYRLYETLSLGRIPVFVDTECVLPLEFEVDWRDHCVWVEEDEIDVIGDRILAFHESVSDAEFEERQRACRRLWETRIAPQGFFASFHRHFQP